MGFIAGSVSEGSIPISTGILMRAFRLDDGSLEEEVTSDGDGLFIFTTVVTGDEYTVVAFDDATGTVYNAVVYDRIVAVATLDQAIAAGALESAGVGIPEASFVDWDSYVTIHLPLHVDESNAVLGAVTPTAVDITDYFEFGAVFDYPNGSISATGITETIFGTSDFTVECMVQRQDTSIASGDTVVFVTLYDSISGRYLTLAIDENFLVVLTDSDGASPLTATSIDPLIFGVAQRVAVTCESDVLRLYVDDGLSTGSTGTLQATLSIGAGTVRDFDAFYLGLSPLTTASVAANTALGEFRIHNGVARYVGASYPTRVYL